MGFLGASPKFPCTAFSIRLMRFHQIMWQFCAVRVEPFTRALDVYLDASNPLILSSRSYQVRNLSFHPFKHHQPLPIPYGPFNSHVNGARRSHQQSLRSGTSSWKQTAHVALVHLQVLQKQTSPTLSYALMAIFLTSASKLGVSQSQATALKHLSYSLKRNRSKQWMLDFVDQQSGTQWKN